MVRYGMFMVKIGLFIGKQKIGKVKINIVTKNSLRNAINVL